MKVKQIAIIAALMVAAIAPVKAQDFQKINDSTWMMNDAKYPYRGDSVSMCMVRADFGAVIAQNRNSMRTAGGCLLGAMGCTAASCGFALWGAKSNDKLLRGLSIGFGIGAIALDIAGAAALIKEKVYLTPEGVIVKLDTDKKNPKK